MFGLLSSVVKNEKTCGGHGHDKGLALADRLKLSLSKPITTEVFSALHGFRIRAQYLEYWYYGTNVHTIVNAADRGLILHSNPSLAGP